MNYLKIPGKFSAEQLTTFVTSRQKYLLSPFIDLGISKNTVYWEELTCVGYNPQAERLEAIISIKQSSGYSGNLCSVASKEYVRFFVDFKDGSGWQNMGFTSTKVADISEIPTGPQHPIMYMAQLYIDDAKYRRFLSCNQAVIPTVRAILSWNTIPSADPDYHPYYGNVLNRDIQLGRKSFFIWQDIIQFAEIKKLPPIDPQIEIPVAPPVPYPIEKMHKEYTAMKIEPGRTFYAAIGSQINSETKFLKSTAYSLQNINDLGISVSDISDFIIAPVTKADVNYEELKCVGLNTSLDTIGAVLHIKKSGGYGGDLCSTGSTEYVAFWADWDNNGVYDQYLGTTSINVHDISNIPAGGLYYNVALPVDLSHKLKSCSSPNIIRIRGVLSWQSLPSTTNPSQLNHYGNYVDAVVQIRPGISANVDAEITYVGNVDRDDIDPVHHLYNYNASSPTSANNRPWGGWVSFHGIIDRNGYNGVVKYKIMYKKYGASDLTYATVSTNETFSMIDFTPNPNLEYNDNQIAADGWFTYKQNPALQLYNETNYLAGWNTGGLSNGTYTIKMLYTDALNNIQVADEFSMIINNTPMTVNPNAGVAVNTAYDLDLAILGGDCHSYTDAASVIDGRVRAVHAYFAEWNLELQPTAHTHGVKPSPENKFYSFIGDNGSADDPWSLDTALLDPCGYTVRLIAKTRVILNSSPGTLPQYGPKAVGFAVLS